MSLNPFIQSFSVSLQILSDWDRLEDHDFEKKLQLLSQLKEEQKNYLEKLKESKLKISEEVKEDLKKDQQITKVFIEHLENEKNKIGLQLRQISHLISNETKSSLSVDV